MACMFLARRMHAVFSLAKCTPHHVQLIFKGLGAIPGPIVLGAVLGDACLFKQSSCHAADASCVVMDNRKASQARHCLSSPLTYSLGFFMVLVVDLIP